MVSFLFVLRDNRVDPLAPLAKVHGAQGFQVVSHGPKVLITGGEYSLGRSDWNLEVWTYDTTLDEWKRGPDLQTCRRHHSVCVSPGKMFCAHCIVSNRKRLT